MDDLALRKQERDEHLQDSQRSLMTIGDRRASIAAEIPNLRKQIATREGRMKGEDFLTDAQKNDLTGVSGKARDIQVNALRDKFEDVTEGLKERMNRETGDLRQKPLSFNADSLAKTGLYSASALQFNPVLGLKEDLKEHTKLLSEIARNTNPYSHMPGRSSHSP